MILINSKAFFLAVKQNGKLMAISLHKTDTNFKERDTL